MSSSAEDFLEVLENDDAEVDVAKLADMAQHGVPAEVRGAVWKYLLGAAHADKTNEVSATRDLVSEYSKLSKSNAALELKAQRHLDRLARQNSSVLSLSLFLSLSLILMMIMFSNVQE
jgi:hypothetical protein